MRLRTLPGMLVGSAIVALIQTATPASAAPSQSGRATVGVGHALSRVVEEAGPQGENVLCDRFYAFTDEAGEFTLQHQCGGNTAPWGYRIAPPLRAIAVSPVIERGMDWTANGVPQPRLAPHQEAADYIFHGTFPNTPDGATITYIDHFSFRHGVGEGGDVNIDVKGAFTLSNVRG